MLAACSGDQQGYYAACDEPAGVALGCEPGTPDAPFTAWDACTKLATCGVIVAAVDDDDNDETPTVFEDCVDRIEQTEASQGDLVLHCIETSECPELAATDPMSTQGDDPNPADGNIEGVLGFCGRLDP